MVKENGLVLVLFANHDLLFRVRENPEIHEYETPGQNWVFLIKKKVGNGG